METFDLELRVTTFGSILTWQVKLEDATDPKNVTDWSQGKDYVFKKLPGFKISDSILDVFVGCSGIKGGEVTCEVLINGGKRDNKVVSKVTDKNYANESYQISNNF